jgi:hypothetical protein
MVAQDVKNAVLSEQSDDGLRVMAVQSLRGTRGKALCQKGIHPSRDTRARR